VLFDPAGSWWHPQVPERNDVLYGMSPPMFEFYMDYHARETYHVVVQEVTVAPETAAQLMAVVQAYGAVPQARCALSVSDALSQTPGFETIRQAWFPRAVMTQFAEIPGVRTRQVFDDDSDDNLELLRAQARADLSRQIARDLARD
jgi:hypothetical protein